MKPNPFVTVFGAAILILLACLDIRTAAAATPSAAPTAPGRVKKMTGAGDTTTFRDLEQQLRGIEEKFNSLKQNDSKMMASAKLSDEARATLLKEITELSDKLAGEIATSTKGKKLTEKHAKSLTNRIQGVKSWLAESDKKEKEKAKRLAPPAASAAPAAPAAPTSAAPTAPATTPAPAPAAPATPVTPPAATDTPPAASPSGNDAGVSPPYS